VLICSSILGDFAANYHRERLLGQAISSQGHGSIRFHYAGEGNSQGDRRLMSFESMCDDARAVMEYCSSLGFDRFGLLGTRIGALVSAAVIASQPSVPLAFWEPITNPLAFIADAQRAKKMSRLTQTKEERPSQTPSSASENGVIDILGYDVHPTLIRSLEGMDLVSNLGSLTRPIFIARFRSEKLEKDDLAEALVSRGFPVKTAHYGLSESWWFDRMTTLESGDLVVNTAAWLAAALADAL
jgi:hypothetical protein